MKKNGSSEAIAGELKKLQDLKAHLAAMEAETAPVETFNRADSLILRKMYVVPAFEIHKGPLVCMIWALSDYVETNMLNLASTSWWKSLCSDEVRNLTPVKFWSMSMLNALVTSRHETRSLGIASVPTCCCRMLLTPC